MKRLLIALGLVLSAAPWLTAAELSKEEIKRATDHLKKTSAAFVASTKGLSEAQLNFKAGPTRWSVAECAEHIAAAEDFLMGMVREKVMNAPPRADVENVKELDDLVVKAIADRTKKATAPEPLMPTKRYGTVDATVAHFKESRAKTIKFVTETKGLRDHAADSPLGKKLDAYEYVLFISAHTERHTKQIEEVKADANFPKA